MDRHAGAVAGAPVDPVPATAASGWVFRAAASLHLLLAFGQAVFAGVYLSGDFDGLGWHASGADLVSYLGVAQLVVAVVVLIRLRRAWPLVASAALSAAEWVQYAAGTSGSLWLHIPLGVAVVAATVLVFAAAWLRPLPRRSPAARPAPQRRGRRTMDHRRPADAVLPGPRGGERGDA